jgi:hypothetical protein
VSTGVTSSGETIESPPEVKAARFGGVAAILAGILGGLVVSVGTVYVTNLQVSAEDDRSRVEFLRTQQQGAYANFIADSNALDDATNQYYTDVVEASARLSGDEGEIDAYWAARTAGEQQLASTYRELSNSLSVVQLIGSSAAANEAGQVGQVQRDAMRDLRRASIDGSNSADVARQRLRNAQLERTRLLERFVAAARRDLGTD